VIHPPIRPIVSRAAHEIKIASATNCRRDIFLTALQHPPADASRQRNPIWFGLSALPQRGDFAHDGWAIDVLEALARPREEAIRIRSVVE
jgi:hypothetical protein